MRSFAHHDARSVREACGLLRHYDGRAVVIAGGTDLLGVLKDEILFRYPEAVINLKTVPGLEDIREHRNGVTVGALTRLSEIASSPLIRERYGALAEAARSVATPQIRNVGTLGGNLCQEVRCWYFRYPRHLGGPIRCLRKGSGPCAAVSGDNRYHAIMGGKRCFAACPSDTAVALAALDATVGVAGAEGKRRIPVQDFLHPLGTALRPGEIVTEVRVPRPPERASQTFLKFTVRKPVDFAIASVACVVRLQGGACAEARLALGAVAPMPVRAAAAERLLRGRTLDEGAAAEAAEAALAGARPLSRNAHKIEIAKALVRRALAPIPPGG